MLSGQSSVFGDMFAYSEGDQKEELTVSDMRPEVLQKVLEFVYLGIVGQ